VARSTVNNLAYEKFATTFDCSRHRDVDRLTCRSYVDDISFYYVDVDAIVWSMSTKLSTNVADFLDHRIELNLSMVMSAIVYCLDELVEDRLLVLRRALRQRIH
jgi:hypothetical protein